MFLVETLYCESVYGWLTELTEGRKSPIFANISQQSRVKDLTIGWQNLNPLSHPNATLAPRARQARPSGENLNYLLSLVS